MSDFKNNLIVSTTNCEIRSSIPYSSWGHVKSILNKYGSLLNKYGSCRTERGILVKVQLGTEKNWGSEGSQNWGSEGSLGSLTMTFLISFS